MTRGTLSACNHTTVVDDVATCVPLEPSDFSPSINSLLHQGFYLVST